MLGIFNRKLYKKVNFFTVIQCIYMNFLTGLSTPVVHLVSANKNNFVLRCQVDGYGDITITWFHDEEIIQRSEHYGWGWRKLYIKNATFKQNGMYSCGATNKAGSAISSKNYLLKLKGKLSNFTPWRLLQFKNFSDNSIICSKAGEKLCRGKRDGSLKEAANIKFLKQPSDLIVAEDKKAVLECLFKASGGERSQTIKWRKDGSLFRLLDLSKGSDKLPGRVVISQNDGSLVFNYTQASDDGSYDCVIANNADGSEIKSHSAKLTVLAKLKFNPKPVGKTLELGTTGKIHCRAQGTPTPVISWIKDGKSELPFDTVVENGTLVFEKVRFEQQGEYSCVATNTQGTINATVQVVVAVAPQ